MEPAVPYEIRKSGAVSPDMFQLIDAGKPGKID